MFLPNKQKQILVTIKGTRTPQGKCYLKLNNKANKTSPIDVIIVQMSLLLTWGWYFLVG